MPLTTQHTLIWFRNDLRIHDNPALYHAVKNSKKVSAIYVDTPQQWQQHNLSARRITFTAEAVDNLCRDLNSLGISLQQIKTADFSSTPEVISEYCQENDIEQLVFNCEYAINERRRDWFVTDQCKKLDIEVKKFHGSVVVPPGTVTTAQNTPYKVFTPFKRAWLQQVGNFLQTPLSIGKSTGKENTHSASADDIALWPGNEAEAQFRLKNFIESRIEHYDQQRDIPLGSGTSTLSPYLAMGLISPHTCLHAALSANQGEFTSGNAGICSWINELIWREFYIHLMVAFPDVCKHKPLRPETDHVKWSYNKEHFQRWCEGRTGFPLVDAAMQQLNSTGWMHNRLRMVTATFLSKYLLIDWRWGERYFMQQLVDGHIAANNGGWQWCASTGSDAAPYFRILSPVRQAERFDPDATFIKQMLPQLAHLSTKIIHQPGHPQLLACGYPEPMVDLKEAKERCVAAFKAAAELAK